MNFDALHNARNTTITSLGLTAKGLKVPRYADFIEMMIQSYEADTGVRVNREPGDALYSIFVVLARQAGEISELVQAVYDGQDPDNATGVQLDAICSVSGIRRHRRQQSVAVLKLTGDPGVTVPDGKRVADSRNVWWTVIDAGEFDHNGEAQAYAAAEEYGPIKPQVGETAAIVNPVYGWQSAVFESVTPGRFTETDSELRARRVQSLQIRGRGSCKAIRAHLLAHSFIKAAVVLENDKPYPAEVGGIPNVPAHSVIPVIVGADNEDGTITDPEQIKTIARTLYSNIVSGVRCYGTDQTGTITGEDGNQKTIAWSYAMQVPVDVVITVAGVDAAAVTPEITALVEQYFKTVQVGDPVRRLPILVAVGGVGGVVGVDVELFGAPADVFVTDIQSGQLGTLVVKN